MSQFDNENEIQNQLNNYLFKFQFNQINNYQEFILLKDNFSTFLSSSLSNNLINSSIVSLFFSNINISLSSFSSSKFLIKYKNFFNKIELDNNKELNKKLEDINLTYIENLILVIFNSLLNHKDERIRTQLSLLINFIVSSLLKYEENCEIVNNKNNNKKKLLFLIEKLFFFLFFYIKKLIKTPYVDYKSKLAYFFLFSLTIH